MNTVSTQWNLALTAVAVALGNPAERVVAARWKSRSEIRFGKGRLRETHSLEGGPNSRGEGVTEHGEDEASGEVVDGEEDGGRGAQGLVQKM